MSAILLDFNKELLFLDGKPIMEQNEPNSPVMINKMLATNISQSPSGDMKQFHWAIDLYKEGTLTLDKVDRDLLKDIVSKMQISNLVKGRVITIIEDAEKEAEKPVEKLKVASKQEEDKQNKAGKGIANNQ